MACMVLLEEKLKALNMTTLSDRRLRGDMIQVWKFVHHESIMDPQTFTSTKSQESRHTRHTAKPLNLVIPQGRLEVRKNFFTVRAVSSWNSLPTWVQNSESMNDFKINYDKFQKVLRRWWCCAADCVLKWLSILNSLSLCTRSGFCSAFTYLNSVKSRTEEHDPCLMTFDIITLVVYL